VHDTGDFDIPLVGAGVWIMFEQGNPDYPIWIGTWPAIPTKELEANTINSWNLPGEPVSMGTWMQPAGSTTPKETQDQLDPQVRVLAKTPKGATIVAIDTDEAETLMIIDRSGQMLEMYSPVTTGSNAGNAAQRGLKTSRANTSLDPSIYNKDQKAYIRIIDSSYQTNESGQRVWSGQFVKLSAEAEKELVRLHGACGHDILLDSSSGQQQIVIKDNKGSFIWLDNDGSIRLKAKNGQKVTIEGNVEFDVTGNHVIKVAGTFEVDCNEFVVKSNNAALNGKSAINIRAAQTTVSGTSNVSVVSNGAAEVSAKGSLDIKAGGSLTESASGMHTTKASHISHTAGSASPASAIEPEQPQNPTDPAGSVTIPDETYPIG